MMNKNALYLLSLLFGLSFLISCTEGETTSTHKMTVKNEDYLFKFEYSEADVHSTRKYEAKVNELLFENAELNYILSQLLNKEMESIQVEPSEKAELKLNTSLKRFALGTVVQNQKDLLFELKRALGFELGGATLPTYELVVENEEAFRPWMMSNAMIRSTKERNGNDLELESATKSIFIGALNELYEGEARFQAGFDQDVVITLKLTQGSIDSLGTQLQKELGLGMKRLSDSEIPAGPIRVTF